MSIAAECGASFATLGCVGAVPGADGGGGGACLASMGADIGGGGGIATTRLGLEGCATVNVKLPRGFRAASHELTFYGTCANCALRPKPAVPAAKRKAAR